MLTMLSESKAGPVTKLIGKLERYLELVCGINILDFGLKPIFPKKILIDEEEETEEWEVGKEVIMGIIDSMFEMMQDVVVDEVVEESQSEAPFVKNNEFEDS